MLEYRSDGECNVLPTRQLHNTKQPTMFRTRLFVAFGNLIYEGADALLIVPILCDTIS